MVNLMSDNNNEAPAVLTVSVGEHVKTIDVGPGGVAPSEEVKPEEEYIQGDEETPEEGMLKQKQMLEYMDLMGRYVEPHNKKSRWVTEADVARVKAEAQIMLKMMQYPRNEMMPRALAHSQIETEDPLRFFVMNGGRVIVNPVITMHTTVPVYKTEGCMSYPYEAPKEMVQRYNKVEVIYQMLAEGPEDNKEAWRLSPPMLERLNGEAAQVAQHEISHLNGCNVYDTDFDPIKAVGFGAGEDVESSLWVFDPSLTPNEPIKKEVNETK